MTKLEQKPRDTDCDVRRRAIERVSAGSKRRAGQRRAGVAIPGRRNGSAWPLGLVIAVAASVGGGCGEPQPGGEVETISSAVIIGVENRHNINEFPTDLEMWNVADSIALLAVGNPCADFSPPDICFLDRIPATRPPLNLCETERFAGEGEAQNGLCTAFLVGDDLMMTAGHCVQPDKGTEEGVAKCSDVALVFGYNNLAGRPASDARVLRSEVYHLNCDSAFPSRVPSGPGDHLLFHTDRPVIGHHRLRIKRGGTTASLGQRLLEFGHGLELPLKVDDQGTVATPSSPVCSPGNRAGCTISTTHDAFPGDSGGPVIDPATGRVVAILVRVPGLSLVPSPTFDSEGPCNLYRTCPQGGCDDPVAAFSEATDIKAVSSSLIPELPAAQAQLLADFDGDSQPDRLALEPINGTYHLTTTWGDRSKTPGDFDTQFPQGNVPPVLDLSWTLSVRDFNGDGHEDIVSAFAGFSPIYLDGQSGLISAPMSPFSTGVSYGGFTVADFNGDGRADLLAKNLVSGAAERFYGSDHGLIRAISIPAECGTAGLTEANDHAHAIAVIPAGLVNSSLEPLLAVDCPGSNGDNRIKFIGEATQTDFSSSQFDPAVTNWRALTYRPDHLDMFGVTEGSGKFNVYRIDFFLGTVTAGRQFSKTLEDGATVTGLTWEAASQTLRVLVDIGDPGTPDRTGAELRTFDENGAAVGAPIAILGCRRSITSGADLVARRTGGVVAGAGLDTVACSQTELGGEGTTLLTVTASGDSPGELYIRQNYAIGVGALQLRDIECDPFGGVLWGVSADGRVIYGRPVDFVGTCPLGGGLLPSAKTAPPAFQDGGWHAGSEVLALDADRALLVSQSGYGVIESPSFDASQLRVSGHELDLDVAFTGPTAPAWAGDVQLYMSVPAPNDFQAVRSLSSIRRGEWTTLRFPLNDAANQALLSGAPNVRIQLGINRPAGAGPLRLANLRFGGPLALRTPPPDGTDPHASAAIFSFDDATAWSSPQAGLAPDPAETTQGSGALRVAATGYSEISSRTFETAGLTPSARLALDVRVPAQQGNPSWFGDVQAFLTCPSAGRYNIALGYQALTGLGVGAFHTLEFAVPSDIVGVLGQPHDDCFFKLALNVPSGSGAYVFDNLRFD